MKSCIGAGNTISILLIMVGIMFNVSRGSTVLAAQEKITLAAGTRLVVMPNSTLNSGKNKTGDRISVALAADLSVNGAVVARRGDKIFGKVIEAKKAGRVVRKPSLEIELTDIVANGQMVAIKTHPFGIEGEGSGEVKKIARRATIGGLIGGADIAKRMVKTGTAIAVITPGKQIQIHQGALMEFYLAEAATLPALSAAVTLDRTRAANMYLQGKGANLKATTRYQWISELIIRKDGEVKSSQRSLVQFDAAGKPVMQPIGAPAKKKRGLRGRVQKRIKKKMEELGDAIRELLKPYALTNPETVRAFFQRAAVCAASGELQGTVQLADIAVINPNDWVALWLDEKTYQPRKLLVKTFLGEDAIQVEVDYQALNDGLLYAARTEIFLPGKELTGTLMNSDYQKN